MDSFDRLVLGIMAGLLLAIGGVVALGDHVGVPIVEMSPVQGESPPVTTAITIRFGEQIQTDTAEERFSVQPPVDGRFSWVGNTLVFRPRRALMPGHTYVVTLAAGVQGVSGRQTKETVSWSFTPRQPRVVYLAADEIQTLWAVGLDGGDRRELYAPSYGVYDYAVGPHGDQIALALDSESGAVNLWLIDADGSSAHQIVSCDPGMCSGPAWSPDGQLLAYERRDPLASGGLGPSHIWLYDMQAEQSISLSPGSQVAGTSPTWSPDGGRFAFFDINAGGIRVIDLGGGEGLVIPSRMGEVGSFSPEGTSMVYADIRPVGRQYFTALWVARFTGEGGLLPLLEEAEEDQAPSWSPDGVWIAFSRRRLDRQGGMGGQLMLLDPGTGSLHQVTDDPTYNNTRFRWDPIGRWLLVQRFKLMSGPALPELWVYDRASREFYMLVEGAVNGQWLP